MPKINPKKVRLSELFGRTEYNINSLCAEIDNVSGLVSRNETGDATKNEMLLEYKDQLNKRLKKEIKKRRIFYSVIDSLDSMDEAVVFRMWILENKTFREIRKVLYKTEAMISYTARNMLDKIDIEKIEKEFNYDED